MELSANIGSVNNLSINIGSINDLSINIGSINDLSINIGSVKIFVSWIIKRPHKWALILSS